MCISLVQLIIEYGNYSILVGYCESVSEEGGTDKKIARKNCNFPPISHAPSEGERGREGVMGRGDGIYKTG